MDLALGGGGMGQGESYSISIPGTSPETPASGSPVGSEIHLPRNKLACFISPPSHPFTHSFSPSFPLPPPGPVSSLNTTLLLFTPADRLLGHHPPFLHTFPVQMATKHTYPGCYLEILLLASITSLCLELFHAFHSCYL